MTTAKPFTGRLVTKRSRLVQRGGVRFWRYQHWPRGTERVVQMRCGDRWDSLVTRGKGLSSSAVKALQQADKTLPSNLDNIELEDLPGIADSPRQRAEQVDSTLTTIDDQQIDTMWATQARGELAGL